MSHVKPSSESCRTMWAVRFPDGRILADSNFKNEADAWVEAIGIPLPGELLRAKKAGYKIMRITVTIDSDTVTL